MNRYQSEIDEHRTPHRVASRRAAPHRATAPVVACRFSKYRCSMLIPILLYDGQVYIVGHTPPGVDDHEKGAATLNEKHNTRYLQLVRLYSDIIRGQFFGHWHSDTFRVIYSDTGTLNVSDVCAISGGSRVNLISNNELHTHTHTYNESKTERDRDSPDRMENTFLLGIKFALVSRTNLEPLFK